jgi:hypothetical protein
LLYFQELLGKEVLKENQDPSVQLDLLDHRDPLASPKL